MVLSSASILRNQTTPQDTHRNVRVQAAGMYTGRILKGSPGEGTHGSAQF